MIVLLAFGYLSAHFIVYAIWLRHRLVFSTERGVFLYHAFSAVATAIGLTVYAGPASTHFNVPHAVIFLSLHAIYSMSFLELWALADGGYSLSILDCLDSNKELPQERLLEELAKLGTMKKQARIADLMRLGLVQMDSVGRYTLTANGRRIARFVAAVVGIANVQVGR